MAKKRLNKKLVVSLTLLAFVMMVVASVLMLRQLQRRDPKYFVERALQYAQRKEWPTAAVFYRKAWEHSHDASYLVSFGDMLLNSGEPMIALNSWRSALINEPNLTRAHVRQIQLLLELAHLNDRNQDWYSVQQAAETFLKSDAKKQAHQAAFAHNANGLALISLARQDENNRKKGEAELRQAVELAPDVVDYSLDLAKQYLEHGRGEEGERLFTELIARHGSPGADAAKVHLAYARYLASKQRFDEAKDYFRKSLALARQDPQSLGEARLGWATFLAQQWARQTRDDPKSKSAAASLKQAETIFKQCIEADPDSYDGYLELAVLYGLTGRHGDKVDICEARLQRGLSRSGLKATRNRLNSFSLMIYASEACVAQAVTVAQEGGDDSREKWLSKAEHYLAGARGEFPAHPRVLSQAGRIKLARGMDRQALEDLRSADEAYQSYDRVNWDNKLMLARLHLKLHEAGSAASLLDQVAKQAVKQQVGAAFWTLYARALFQSNQTDRALALADQVLLADPRNDEARQIKAAVLERKGREREAAELLAGNSTARAILTARAQALEGNTEQAVKVLHEALRTNPTNANLVSVTVRELFYLGRLDDARAVLDKALAASPDNTQLQTLAVLTKEGLSDDERGQALLDIIRRQEDGYQRTLELAGFYWRKNDLKKTLQYTNEALAHLQARDTPTARNATNDQSRALLLTKLDVASSLDDPAAMVEARDAAVRLNVDGAGGQSILGSYHMHRKEYELAIKAFRAAVEAQPTDAHSLSLLGQCLLLNGQEEEAQATYERAVRINPDAAQAHKGLAVLAKERDDKNRFEKELKICERLMPSDPWVRSEVLARREETDPQAAITQRLKLLEKNPDDIDNLTRLASLSESIKDVSQADQYYARLLALRPDDSQWIHTVTAYYQRTDRPAEALALAKLFARSRSTNEKKADAQVLVASCLLDQGDLNGAEKTLLAAADRAPTLPVEQSLADLYLRRMGKPDKALPWLDKIVEQTRSRGSPQLAKAMAVRISCLLQGNHDKLPTARRYVDELLATFPNYPNGLLLDGEVHARMGEISDAIDSLTEFLRQQPDNPYALYQRALHLRSQGRLREAVEDLKVIKQSQPLALDLQPRLLLARLYHQAGRTELWTAELESLVEDAPQSDRAMTALIDAYTRQQRLIDAERVVTVRINRTPTESAAPWYVLRSQVALKLGDDRKALADAQRAADIRHHSADSIATVLGTYAQLGQASEGIRYFQRNAADHADAPALISGYALLLGKAGRTQEAVKQFRRAMNVAIQESPEAIRRVGADLRQAFPNNAAASRAITLFEGDTVPLQGDTAPQQGDGRNESESRVNDRILIDLYRMAENYDGAISKIQQLIATCQKDRERAGLFHELGDVAQLAGQPEEARRAYEQALKYNKFNWAALNNLAYVLFDQLGETKLALDFAHQAVAIADNSATLDTLGWVYVGLGQYRRAIAELSRAVRLDPDHALAYYHLGEAYRRYNHPTEAATILESGLDLAKSEGDTELIGRFQSSLKRNKGSQPEP